MATTMVALAARRAASRPLFRTAQLALSSKSPFAAPSSSSAADSSGKGGAKLSKEEEQRQRVEAMAAMMREKTMREVSAAGASRRPEGVKHMLDIDKKEGAIDDKLAQELGPQYAANYDEDRDEWGGPKGMEPTRFGDWEVKGRISDF